MLRLISTCVLIILLLLGSAAFPFEEPKLLICSDSTTANYTSGVLQGWGFYVGEYLSVPVVNLAKNGRSTRSFIREGLWAELLKRTRPGDWVVVEMGHNDVRIAISCRSSPVDSGNHDVSAAEKSCQP
jgi:rhamnogalacturonan acetylesterase